MAIGPVQLIVLGFSHPDFPRRGHRRAGAAAGERHGARHRFAGGWVLLGAGAATVVEAKLSSAASFLALFFYCVIASSSYLAMEIYTGLRPQRSRQFLARFRAWIDGHTDQVMIWGSLILGLWLIAPSLRLVLS